jgi:hypothetical protein
MENRKIPGWSLHKLSPFLAGGLTVFLVWQLVGQWTEAEHALAHLEVRSLFFWLPVLFAATFVNWWLESEKWRLLLLPDVQVGRRQALANILGAMAIGLVTPGRLGEIPGRSIWYPAALRSTLVSRSLYSSFIQNVWHLAGGMVAALILAYGTINTFLPFSFYVFLAIQLVLIVLCVLFLPQLMRHLANSGYRWIRSLSGTLLQSFHSVSNRAIWRVFLLSGIRYLVYLSQYALILSILAKNYTLQDIFAASAIQFMLQSLLPVPAVLSLPVRGQVAILSCYALQMPAALAVTGSAMLWILNLGLPGLLGAATLFLRKGFSIPADVRGSV